MKPQWQYRTRLGIHDRMTEVVKLAIESTKKQLGHERKKLRKIKYGS